VQFVFELKPPRVIVGVFSYGLLILLYYKKKREIGREGAGLKEVITPHAKTNCINSMKTKNQ
tara:strand:- start:229 stop:414 length:186 start_codon:yes stop_codon:yes gene_type:complete